MDNDPSTAKEGEPQRTNKSTTNKPTTKNNITKSNSRRGGTATTVSVNSAGTSTKIQTGADRHTTNPVPHRPITQTRTGTPSDTGITPTRTRTGEERRLHTSGSTKTRAGDLTRNTSTPTRTRTGTPGRIHCDNSKHIVASKESIVVGPPAKSRRVEGGGTAVGG
eukprot:Lankesteria_metandrocarpae@DN4513_c1_g1_i1.p1